MITNPCPNSWTENDVGEIEHVDCALREHHVGHCVSAHGTHEPDRIAIVILKDDLNVLRDALLDAARCVELADGTSRRHLGEIVGSDLIRTFVADNFPPLPFSF